MVSMKRPSRGERWSATTTRQTGFFLLPTPVSRTRTDIGRERLATGRASATAGQLLQRRHLARRHLLHQLLHLRELLHELRDRLHARARAARDPAAARPVDDLRAAPPRGRHRRDDPREPVQLLLVDVERSELLPDAG